MGESQPMGLSERVSIQAPPYGNLAKYPWPRYAGDQDSGQPPLGPRSSRDPGVLAQASHIGRLRSTGPLSAALDQTL